MIFLLGLIQKMRYMGQIANKKTYSPSFVAKNENFKVWFVFVSFCNFFISLFANKVNEYKNGLDFVRLNVKRLFLACNHHVNPR